MTAKNQVIAILFAVFLIMLYISAKAGVNSAQKPTETATKYINP